MGSLKSYQALDILWAAAAMKKSPLYIFIESIERLPYQSEFRLKDRMDQLVESGALVIYLLHTEIEQRRNMIDKTESIEKECFSDGSGWLYLLESNRIIIDRRKKEKQMNEKADVEEK